MNDEKRPYPLMTEHLLGEEHLSRLYQETATEMPPPGLDAAILDAARQATRQKPRRVYFLALRKWTVPLSLAAALVVTIGVVRSLQHERTSPVLVTQTPAAPRASSSARVDARDENLLNRREENPVQAQEAPAVAPLLKETLKKTTPPAIQAPPSAAGLARSAPAERRGVYDDVPLRMQEPAQLENEESAVSSLHASEAAIQSVPETPGKGKAEEAKKDVVSPDELSLAEWIAEIKKLRRAGNLVEAETRLKAFKHRYPTYPVEKALALPFKSHNQQKGAP